MLQEDSETLLFLPQVLLIKFYTYVDKHIYICWIHSSDKYRGQEQAA